MRGGVVGGWCRGRTHVVVLWVDTSGGVVVVHAWCRGRTRVVVWWSYTRGAVVGGHAWCCVVVHVSWCAGWRRVVVWCADTLGCHVADGDDVAPSFNGQQTDERGGDSPRLARTRTTNDDSVVVRRLVATSLLATWHLGFLLSLVHGLLNP
jgi:hypothetical protein